MSSSSTTTIPPDGRDSRWRQHRIDKRRELVESTVRAIREHGAGVGMDEIAAAAGTSKTVFYRHFGDRLGLYFAVCEAVDNRILKQMHEAARAESGHDSQALLRAVIDSYLRLVERDPELYRFVVQRPNVTLSDGADPVTGLSSRIADELARTMRAASDEQDADRVQATSWALVGLVKESADRWLENPLVPREELAENLTLFAHAGLHAALPTLA